MATVNDISDHRFQIDDDSPGARAYARLTEQEAEEAERKAARERNAAAFNLIVNSGTWPEEFKPGLVCGDANYCDTLAMSFDFLLNLEPETRTAESLRKLAIDLLRASAELDRLAALADGNGHE